MSRIAILGAVHVRADQRATLLDRARPLIEASRAEEGCLDYAFLPDPHDPTLVRIVELWEDEAALRHHFTLPHFAEAGALMGEHVTERGEIAKHVVSWSGGVMDELPG
ncbi:MAG: putative quinol monooxygenase [Actinomycetota bacterium]